MQLSRSIPIGTSGPSFTKILAGGKILVRQGAELVRIAFSTQEIEARLTLPKTYEGQPAGVFQDCYYEIEQGSVTKVALGPMNAAESVPLPIAFADQFTQAAFMQFDSVLVIGAKRNLYLFYLQKLEFKYLNDGDCPEELDRAMFTAVSNTQMNIYAGEKLIQYDSKTRGFDVKMETSNLSGAGQQCIALPNGELIATQPSGLVKYSPETKQVQMLYENSQIQNAAIAPAGKYLVLTDNAGEVLVFNSEYAALCLKAKVAFSFSTRPSGGKAAQQVEQQPMKPGEIRKLFSVNTQQRGESFVSVFGGKIIVVRQGTALMKLSLKDHKLIDQTQMGPYQRVPMGISGNTFFEIYPDHIIHVDLDTLQVQQEYLSASFPTDLYKPAYMPVGSEVVIQTRKSIFGFDGNAKQWFELNKNPCPDEIIDGMILLPSSTKIWICSCNQLIEFDLDAQQFSEKHIAFDGTGCYGMLINEKEFLVVTDYEVQKVTVDGSAPPEKIVEGKYMAGCFPCFAGRYMLIANQDGELELYESAYAEQISRRSVGVSYRFSK